MKTYLNRPDPWMHGCQALTELCAILSPVLISQSFLFELILTGTGLLRVAVFLMLCVCEWSVEQQ